MTPITLVAPLAGWCLPLAEVPDPVFAGRMAGDGVAIDPTGDVLHAPCDGEIVPMKELKHAVTVRAANGLDVLLHVGIDTVKLAGAGFELLVKPGQRVRAGEPLLRFDLALVARLATAAVTPVVLASGGTVLRAAAGRAVAVGDFLMEVASQASEAPAAAPREARSAFLAVPFEHGLHARPAALIAAALRPFSAEVTINSRGRGGNARSTVALMTLGVAPGETVEVRASGAQAAEAIAAIEALFKSSGPVAVIGAAVEAMPAAALGVPRRIDALIGCRGMALGLAVQWMQPEIATVESGRGVREEGAALETALARVKAHLDGLAAAARGEESAILAAHVELIQDPELARLAHEWIARGKSAGHAWSQAARATIAALNALPDLRMRERVGDLRDLENQVLRVLAGEEPVARRDLPERSIVLADELYPSQLVALDRARLAGLCTARGGPTSHVAIIAATMGIPALVAAGPAILAIADGTPLALDAENGRLLVDPAGDEQAAIAAALRERAAQGRDDAAAAGGESRTRDGVAIGVLANIGSAAEARSAVAQGAEGCGLLRTEFLFLERRDPPDAAEQRLEYQRIADALAGRVLTIRTMDLGGDKPIPYLPFPREENPALGLRGLRASLRHPELLRTQLRAILGVRPASQVRILLPMVTDLDDLRAVRETLDAIRRELGQDAAPALGVMIETPASALLADQLAPEVDFLSIGTNDLAQFALAMDRGHPELAARLDGLHPAVLRLVDAASQAGRAFGKEVAVCGNLGSDPVALPVLIGLGVHEISAAPAAVPRLKRTIRSLDANACRALAQEALEQRSAGAVRALVSGWLARAAERSLTGG